MTDQPTQPLTDDELAVIKRRALPSAPEYRMYAVIDRAHLIREVDRLRAENTAQAAELEKARAISTHWEREYERQRDQKGRLLQVKHQFEKVLTEWRFMEVATNPDSRLPSEEHQESRLQLRVRGMRRALGLDQDGEGQANA